MNTTTVSQISMVVGSSLLALTMRGVNWGVATFLRAPMTSTGVILVSGLTLMACTNAMFMQPRLHPAPMFGAQALPVGAKLPTVEPVVVTPVERPDNLAEQAPVQQPQPVLAVAPVQQNSVAAQTVTIGNEDIAQMQAKLQQMGLFNGTVDGYYGPQTADSIRAFEQMFGLPRTGAATPQVIDAVKRAPVNGVSNTGASLAPAQQQVRAPVEPVRLIGNTDAPVTQNVASPLAAPIMPQAIAQPAAQAVAQVQAQPQAQPVAPQYANQQAAQNIVYQPAPIATVTSEPNMIDPASLIAQMQATAPAMMQTAQPQQTAALRSDGRETLTSLKPAVDANGNAIPHALNTDLVSDIQRGLSRLGFLQGAVDGVAGETTAKAIRKFQIFNNFSPTGEVSPAVLDMLISAGAYM